MNCKVSWMYYLNLRICFLFCSGCIMKSVRKFVLETWIQVFQVFTIWGGWIFPGSSWPFCSWTISTWTSWIWIFWIYSFLPWCPFSHLPQFISWTFQLKTQCCVSFHARSTSLDRLSPNRWVRPRKTSSLKRNCYFDTNFCCCWYLFFEYWRILNFAHRTNFYFSQESKSSQASQSWSAINSSWTSRLVSGSFFRRSCARCQSVFGWIVC